jgi:hypothetical protein
VSHALRVAWQVMPVLSGEAAADGQAAASAVLAVAGWRGIRRVCADADGIAGCRVRRPGGPSLYRRALWGTLPADPAYATSLVDRLLSPACRNRAGT